MGIREFVTTRLVKSEDLNHHGTLFAGRMSEWFVEGCFIAAATAYGNPEEIVCVKLHGLKFGKPAQKGQIIKLTTKVVLTGNTSITVYGKVSGLDDQDIAVDGFITFVCVDHEGKKKNHRMICPEPVTEEEKHLQMVARQLK
jgi:acyl-CoA hydrolase